MRLFTAIELPDGVKAALGDLVRRVASEGNGLTGGQDVKWVRPENLHITLKFLGDVPDADVPNLCEALARVPVEPMRLTPDRMLYFPKRGRVRVVAAGLAGHVDRLERLFAEIEGVCAELGFEREGRRYTPHVTLGRPRFGKANRIARVEAFPILTFDADRFVLMQSELSSRGAAYTPVRRFPVAR